MARMFNFSTSVALACNGLGIYAVPEAETLKFNINL